MTEHTLSTADFVATGEQRSETPSPPPTDAQPVTRQAADRSVTEKQEPLFAGEQAEEFRNRWSEIQTSFVDEPRRAVEQADGLVAEVMQRLARMFADERSSLEQQWDRQGETDTEALRQALRRYRSFFDRLLSM